VLPGAKSMTGRIALVQSSELLMSLELCFRLSDS
jgi:hypothetical protein